MELQVLVLLLWLVTGPVQSLKRVFWYRHTPKTWEEAQQFCRSNHGADLATVDSDADLSQMDLTKFKAWIGLKKESGVWKWIDSSPARRKKRSSIEKRNANNIEDVFKPGEPQDVDECGTAVFSQSKAYGDVCDRKHFIYCESQYLYHFIPETKTWAEGWEYCHKNNWKYMDFVSLRDIPNNPIGCQRDFPVWTGLHHDGGTWRWKDGTQSQYRNWASGSSLSPTTGSCVAVSSQNRVMSVHNCFEAFPFLCSKHFVVLVPRLLSWEQAAEHCGNISPTAGLSHLKESELQDMLSIAKGAKTSKVWVGLRFLAGSWLWSNGAPLSLPSLPLCPESKHHCGALAQDSGSIEPTDCSQKLNLLCNES